MVPVCTAKRPQLILWMARATGNMMCQIVAWFGRCGFRSASCACAPERDAHSCSSHKRNTRPGREHSGEAHDHAGYAPTIYKATKTPNSCSFVPSVFVETRDWLARFHVNSTISIPRQLCARTAFAPDCPQAFAALARCVRRRGATFPTSRALSASSTRAALTIRCHRSHRPEHRTWRSEDG